jgi:hypothetical protein
MKAAFLNHLTLAKGTFFPETWFTFTPELNVSQITFSRSLIFKHLPLKA